MAEKKKKETAKKAKSEGIIKIAEIRGKSADELKDLLANYKKEALNLRFQAQTGQLQSAARIRHVRRNIAKIQTVVSEQRKEANNA